MKTEIEYATEWILDLSDAEIENINKRLNSEFAELSNQDSESRILFLFRKVVIEPWFKNRESEMIPTDNTSAFLIYQKESLNQSEPNIEAEGCAPWLNQYDYDQIEEEIQSGKSKFVKLVAAIAENDSNIEAESEVNVTKKAETKLHWAICEKCEGEGDIGILTKSMVFVSSECEKCNGTGKIKTSEPNLIAKLKEVKEHLEKMYKPFSGNGTKAGYLSHEVIKATGEFLESLKQL